MPDRLLTSSGGESYALGWDENGQLTSSAAATLEYDWEGRLYQGQGGSDWLSLKYDPDGNRVARSSSRTGSRRYIVDTAADLPVILLEINPANSEIVKSYYYADEQLICQHKGDPNTGPKYFYLTDRIGSVRQVIDVNGCVRHLYSYGPFGKKLEADDDHDGPGNNFQFTGQYFDTEINQLHLRARQYSPNLNIFTTRDPVSGNFSEPLTLHAYLYCLNDPVNRTDPSGEMSLGDTTAAAGLSARLYGSAAGSVTIGNRLVQQLQQSIAAYNLRTTLVTNAMRLGQGAERAVQQAFNLTQNMSQVRYYLETGAYRVFDFVSGGQFIEVKNVAELRMTPQLRDMITIALREKGTLNLVIRASTYIPPSLRKWLVERGVEIVNILPDL